MDLKAEHVDVWAASMRDEPGALAEKLAAVADAGADLDFIIARRSPEEPGTGVVFLTPLRGDAEIAAASEAGFAVTKSLHSVRIEGPNRAGIAAELSQKLGDAGINLRGLSAAVAGETFVIYLAFDTSDDADEAVRVLRGTS